MTSISDELCAAAHGPSPRRALDSVDRARPFWLAATARSSSTPWGAIAVGCALLFASSSAAGQSGQTSDRAAARSLFNEARKLTNEGRYDRACPKFEESMRLDNGIGTRFNVADCWEHIGRTASAWSLFLDVAASAKSAGQADREKVARQRAAALEPHLPRLMIRVPSPTSGLEVRKNDIAVGQAQWGTATPVDPGSYVIEARAAGKKSWKTTITVASDGPVTSVAIPPLETEASAEVSARPAETTSSVATTSLTAPQPSVAPSRPEADVDRGSSGLRTVGWVLGAAGLAGVGLGAVFAAMTKSTDDKLDTLCTGGPAGNECADEFERVEFDRSTIIAENRAKVSYGGFIGGGVTLVTGTILILVSGSSDGAPHPRGRPTIVTPLVGTGTLGVGIRGAW